MLQISTYSAGNELQMAHEQLVQSSQRLREQGQACPNELMRSLMLLHSYVLVKTLVRLGDHSVRPPPPPPPPPLSIAVCASSLPAACKGVHYGQPVNE